MKWKTTQLKEVAEIIMGQSPDSASYNDKGEGLPFFQGKAEFGHKFPIAIKFCTRPIKIAQNEDILLSVRAPVGAVNIASEQCCIGRGLASIRRIKNQLDYLFLYYFFLSQKKKLEGMGVGSTFQAISKKDIEELHIPLPPLPVQQKIAQVLDEADALIQKRKQLIAKLDELLQSVFLEMFGDPVTNSKGWQVFKLSEIGELARGISKHRPRNDPSLLGGIYPLIQTGDISNSGIYLYDYKQTYSELGLKQSKMWPKGTLCITIAANIADASILQFEACFPDSVVGFLPINDKTNCEYIYFWLHYLKRYIEEKAPQVAQKNINLKILSELDVPLPPIDLQRQFSKKVQETEKLRLKMLQQLTKLEENFNALLHRAFRGELELR